MSNQNELNKISSLENENNLLKNKIKELEQIINLYKPRDNCSYSYNIPNSYYDADVEIESPIFKSIPYVKRMNAFNYTNE